MFGRVVVVFGRVVVVCGRVVVVCGRVVVVCPWMTINALHIIPTITFGKKMYISHSDLNGTY